MCKCRIFRCLICAVVICCIMINFLSFHADATLVVSTAGYIITVNVVPVVSAALVGLGVGAIAASTGAFDTLVANCVSHLQNIGLCQEYSIDVFGYQVNGTSLFGLTPTIIDAIRSWLYESEAVTQTTVLSTSGFSVSSVSAVYANSYGPSAYNDSRFVDTLKNAFDNQQAIVAACSSAYLVGLYWGSDGLLYRGTWNNPMGSVHSSLLGCYDLSSLSLVDSKLYCECYYSKYYAELNKDWLTSSYRAFDFDDLSQFTLYPYNGSFYIKSPVYVKKATDSIWSTSKTVESYFWSWQAGSYSDLITTSLYYPTGKQYVTWEDSSTTTISVADGLSQGEIALQEESLEVGYSDWYSNSKVLTTTDDQQVQVYPFPYSNAISDYYTATQQGIWDGTLTNTGTGTGDNTNTGSGSDVWNPPENPGQFALDLSNYFPFCIPFDLYDFFSCLNADPVAPVIHWEIALPGGSTYPIELDLSPFDSVAQLLRRLQLLLFIVGLAVKTRDLIKG